MTEMQNMSLSALLKNKTIDTITNFVMVLLVIMGLVLVVMEMDPLVSTSYRSPSIGGLLKPINPIGICPKTYYRTTENHF